MNSNEVLGTKIFADGADKDGMLAMYQNPLVKGFTTNPSLMRKAGITDYKTFAQEILKVIKDRPISLEVLADDFNEMRAQAYEISSWGENVYVKIPITNTHGRLSFDLIRMLAKAGIKQNVTAVMALDQVRDATAALAHGPASIISVFAGRIADTGRDPQGLMSAAVEMIRPYPQLEILWASCREVLNVFQANAVGCHIITVPNEILVKMDSLGKDLHVLSLEAVKIFYEDVTKAGYTIETKATEIA